MSKQLNSDIEIGFPPTEEMSPRQLKLIHYSGRGEKARECHIILVHGFNVRGWSAETRFDEFRGNAKKVSKKMSTNMITISWPGKSFYWSALSLAKNSAKVLADYLATLETLSGSPCQLVLIGHSLGCRVILEALKRLENDSKFCENKVDIFLMAAAVPVHFVTRNQRLYAAVRMARSRMVFYSWVDWVLAFTFPPGQAIAASADPAEGEYPEAVGFMGAPIDVWTDRQRMWYGHGQYWTSKSIVQQIGQKLGLADTRQMPSRSLPFRFGADGGDRLADRHLD